MSESYEFIINPLMDPCTFFLYRLGEDYIHYQYADFKKGTSRAEFHKELDKELLTNPIIVSKKVFMRYAIEVEHIFEDLQEVVFNKDSSRFVMENLEKFLSSIDLLSYKDSFIQTIIYDHCTDIINKYYELNEE